MGQPFLLYVPFNAPHTPLQVPEQYVKPYAHLPRQRALYAGMTAALDEAVGQIVAALEETKLMENTLIVFSSDNGGPVNQGATNGSLRVGKGTLYEAASAWRPSPTGGAGSGPAPWSTSRSTWSIGTRRC